MTNFGERLRFLRNKRKLTMKELGEKVGLTESAIGMIERGERNPSFDKLQELSNFFEVDVNYLIGLKDLSYRQKVDKTELQEALDYFYNKLGFRSDDDLIESNSEQSLISLYKEIRKYPNLTKEEISVKYYGDYMNQETGELITRKDLIINKLKLFNNPVSAGYGSWLDDGCEYNYVDLDHDYNHADFALKVKGDSMSPLYNDGDIVLVKSLTLIEPGQVGVFVLNNEGYLKQWQGNRLISINQNYKPIQISEDDKFFIVGKVVDRIENKLD